MLISLFYDNDRVVLVNAIDLGGLILAFCDTLSFDRQSSEDGE